MSLSEKSYGYRNTIINNTGRHVSLSLVKNLEARLSTVAALARNPSGRRKTIRNQITRDGQAAIQRGQEILIESNTSARKSNRSNKGRIKYSSVAIYVSVFTLLVSVIAVGYRAPESTTTAVSATPDSTVANVSSVDQSIVNDIVATDIAASVAQIADLAIASNVAELAVSTKVQSEYVSTSGDSSAITKPTIVQLSSASRNITQYTVQPGDTVDSVAALYGISADTIKWSNNLTGSSLAEGSTIDILPRDGIVYTVKDGDTVASIADRYKADASIITTYNDLEINGVTAGLKIIIPNGTLPETERPGYVAPAAAPATFITGYSSGFSNGSTWYIRTGTPNYGSYAYGNCTAYSYDRRLELGRPIGARWGNAGTWAYYAKQAGYTVNRTPAAGAVIQDSGHVAIVESVLANGDLSISEMNAYVSGGGFNKVSGRILPASQVGQYYYIH